MDRIMTWPNVITVSRMVCGIVGVYIALVPGYFLLGILIYFVLGLIPDFIDGWVARTYNQRTRIGEFIDPLADKVLFYFAIITLFSQYVWWFGLSLLFVCDVVSTVVHFYKNGGAVKTGKWKFGLQCITLGAFSCSVLINRFSINFVNSGMMFVFFGFVMLFFSILVMYFHKKENTVRADKTKFVLQCVGVGSCFLGILLVNYYINNFKAFIVFGNMTIFLALSCAVHSLYHRIRG